MKGFAMGITLKKAAPYIGVAAAAGAGCLAWAAVMSSYGPLTPEDEELIKDYPHSDLDCEKPDMHAGRAVTIDAPPERVYPYLKQLGCDKAGFYSYSTLERLFNYQIYNTYTIEDKWQHPQVGDWVPYRQNGAGTGITAIEENRAFCTATDSRKDPGDPNGRGTAWYPRGFEMIAWSWDFYTIPVENGTKTRFVTINDVYWGTNYNKFWFFVALLIYGMTGNIMSGKMLQVIKGCAEGTNPHHKFQKAMNAYRSRRYLGGDKNWGTDNQ